MLGGEGPNLAKLRRGAPTPTINMERTAHDMRNNETASPLAAVKGNLIMASNKVTLQYNR